MRSRRKYEIVALAAMIIGLTLARAPAEVATPGLQKAARFVGETRCGNPTCHGAAVPTSQAAKKDWKPWKSARTQWLNSNVDHHSRAYRTLETPAARAIAKYMQVEATTSQKCLMCHAPDAVVEPAQGTHQRRDGVSCEHCHGPAEFWLKPHSEKDWKQKKAEFERQGFYDNGNFARRAEKCASCHVDIDHEIVAGGHPPLQFEMVAYAQIMKHWDDQAALPPGASNPDPKLWSIGQLVGLRRTLQMIARRAGDENYQALGKFRHFEDRNCYQCHHKLLEDGLRQAQGHYEMVDVIVSLLWPGQRNELDGLWNELVAGVRASAEQAQQKAKRLDQWLAPEEQQIVNRQIDASTTRKLLERITASGERLKSIRQFRYSQPSDSNVTEVDNIGVPWWYTTGAPEQTILAIEALCDPAFGEKCRAITPELRQLLAAVDRFNYRPELFSRHLGAIHARLFR
jgi:Cytochrome c554 and c-prime